MAMPPWLEQWWKEHPERYGQRHRYVHRFPADGTLREQVDWFRLQFLKLADKASSDKERGQLSEARLQGDLGG